MTLATVLTIFCSTLIVALAVSAINLWRDKIYWASALALIALGVVAGFLGYRLTTWQ